MQSYQGPHEIREPCSISRKPHRIYLWKHRHSCHPCRHVVMQCGSRQLRSHICTFGEPIAYVSRSTVVLTFRYRPALVEPTISHDHTASVRLAHVIPCGSLCALHGHYCVLSPLIVVCALQSSARVLVYRWYVTSRALVSTVAVVVARVSPWVSMLRALSRILASAHVAMEPWSCIRCTALLPELPLNMVPCTVHPEAAWITM